jgi:hypothetical protein
MFSQAWLNEPDAEGHFPTNGDRFAAQELTKGRDTEGYVSICGFISTLNSGSRLNDVMLTRI